MDADVVITLVRFGPMLTSQEESATTQRTREVSQIILAGSTQTEAVNLILFEFKC